MQNLDEFRVSNYTKTKLKDQLDIKNDQIYSFVTHRDQQLYKQQQRESEQHAALSSQIDSNSSESRALDQRPMMEHQLLVEKPTVAQMGETNCNFEARVLEALQVFAEAEYSNDILMPTTSFQPVCIKDKAFQEYVKNDPNFKQLYTGATTKDKSLEQTNENSKDSNSGPI